MDYFDVAEKTVSRYGGNLSRCDREVLVADIVSHLWEKEQARPGQKDGYYYRIARNYAINWLKQRDGCVEHPAGGLRDLAKLEEMGRVRRVIG